MAEKERKDNRKRRERARCPIQAMYKDAKKAVIRLTDLDHILR